MADIIKKIKIKVVDKKFIPYYVILFVSIIVCIPLCNRSLTPGSDSEFSLYRNQSTARAILDGQIIPLVDPDAAGGFGYSMNIFYGVLSTYFIGLFRVILPTWGASINLFLFLSLFLSGVFMYNFAKDFSKNDKIALLASLLYITAPYHLLDLYVRQAQGEFISFTFMPILFHGIYNLINDSGNKFYLIVIGAVSLILTHILSTFMSLIFVILYLLLNIKKVFNKKIIIKLCICLLFIVTMSLITTIPLLEAKYSADYAVFDKNFMGTNPTLMNRFAISIDRLFADNIYKEDVEIGYLHADTMPLILGLHVIISVFLLPMVISKCENKKDIYQFLFLGILCVILCLRIINWNYLPDIFSVIQFPWRFLQYGIFFLSIISAVSIFKIFDKFELKEMFIMIAIMLYTVNPLIGYITYSDRVEDTMLYKTELFTREDNTARVYSHGIASGEYLTMNGAGSYQYLKDRKHEPVILTGGGVIENVSTNGTRINFNIKSVDNSSIELPYMYYPGYTIYATGENGEKIKQKAIETNHGLVGFNLEGTGNYYISSRFTSTSITQAAYAVSVASMIVFIIYVIRYRKNNPAKENSL